MSDILLCIVDARYPVSQFEFERFELQLFSFDSVVGHSLNYFLRFVTATSLSSKIVRVFFQSPWKAHYSDSQQN